VRQRTSAAAVVIIAVGSWITAGALVADPPAVRAQSPTPSIQIGHVQDSSFGGTFPSKRPIFVLAIGSDARPGVCEPVERCLADSIHLIGINPKERGGSIVGLPRDSYVEIPGVGTRKINDALFNGGPELVVETVEQLVGVEIDYYFLTSFVGFRHMVNDVGGLEVELPYSVAASGGLPTIAAGRQVLDGALALALARNRKGVPNGDFSRSENQGLLLMAALERFRKDMRNDPLSVFTWVLSGLRHIQTELSAGEMFQLALAAMTIEPNRVVNRVAPGSIGFAGEASVVFLGGEAEAMFQDVADDGLLELTEG
jgi:polyisoprenyl-teichoic acid--peptidoglycan teichoic acid transferase